MAVDELFVGDLFVGELAVVDLFVAYPSVADSSVADSSVAEDCFRQSITDDKESPINGRQSSIVAKPFCFGLVKYSINLLNIRRHLLWF
ncbi:MAG: hypothetical protein LBT62_07430 [Deltaproteobacteria bacterium]|jgi:hypothetical protein|nr:hypothetical protein [Deltaproteobacteria bacterium]